MAAKFKVTDEVRDVLQRSRLDESAPPQEGGRWYLTLPERLEPKVYCLVMKVIDGAGGVWNRGLGYHVFTKDPRETLGFAVEHGVGTNEKQARQAFYSPPEVAKRVVELAEIPSQLPPGFSILEPSAGVGGLIGALTEAAYQDARIVCYETDPAAAQKLRSKLALRSTDRVFEQNFLSACYPAGLGNAYDRVLMNPPWTKGQDVAHVLHALLFLKPGGVLVAVMPAGADPSILSPGGKGKKESKRAEWVRVCREHDYDWWPLPDGSFRESGTNIKSGIVRMRRPS